jgi:mannan polymerase II complex MNN10 subunit
VCCGQSITPKVWDCIFADPSVAEPSGSCDDKETRRHNYKRRLRLIQDGHVAVVIISRCLSPRAWLRVSLVDCISSLCDLAVITRTIYQTHPRCNSAISVQRLLPCFFLSSLFSPPEAMYASPTILTSKFFVWPCLFLIGLPFILWYRGAMGGMSVPYPRPPARPVTQFVSHGDSKCLPQVTPEFIEAATTKRAKCRKYSPFASARWRIATVSAHFGEAKEHYRMALETHLFHSLVHGTEVRVMCDAIVDDLWNKPAFILDLLFREMMKPEKERLEWIQWADRDTLILDQCRPISSFLLPLELPQANNTATHLLVTEDWNGLNNGVFLLRVNSWAVDLFTAILAFRHYRPEVDLPFTEQSAMEQVLRTHQFRDQTRFVPQHWFNAYEGGAAELFEQRKDEEGLKTFQARRGDYLVHFAGHGSKDQAIREWKGMLDTSGDIWEEDRVLRDVSKEIEAFWKGVGHAR